MIIAKIEQFVKSYKNDIILLIGVILISLLSFAFGYIAAKQQEKEPLQFEMTNDQFPPISSRVLDEVGIISNKFPISKYPSLKI